MSNSLILPIYNMIRQQATQKTPEEKAMEAYAWFAATARTKAEFDAWMADANNQEAFDYITLYASVLTAFQGNATAVANLKTQASYESIMGALPVGQVVFDVVGTDPFVVPVGVFSVSAVCIGGGGGAHSSSSGGSYAGGGGGLGYKNNIPVTPGEVLTVTVGAGGLSTGTAAVSNGGSSIIERSDQTVLVAGYGGMGQGDGGVTGWAGEGGGFFGDGGGIGGNGSISGGYGKGGGGAGGYDSVFQGGVPQPGTSGGPGGPGSGAAGGNGNFGGGGGGGGSGSVDTGGSGGGVGLLGQGSSGLGGAGSTADGHGGFGGSGGHDAALASTVDLVDNHYSSTVVNAPGLYGGGAGSSDTNSYSELAPGAQGAIRIIWPGNERMFPSTRTADE